MRALTIAPARSLPRCPHVSPRGRYVFAGSPATAAMRRANDARARQLARMRERRGIYPGNGLALVISAAQESALVRRMKPGRSSAGDRWIDLQGEPNVSSQTFRC